MTAVLTSSQMSAFAANDAAIVHEDAQTALEGRVAALFSQILDELHIARDHNTLETPQRVARMLVRDVCRGRFNPAPSLTDFPNVAAVDQIYAVGPIAIRSTCAHHFVPILGHAWVGLLPSDRLIGLSKFHRLADWIMGRPQIQEEATEQLADAIERAIAPIGLGVVVRARHFCTAWRGVRDEPSLMTTSVMRGSFRDTPAARAEFMHLLRGMGFGP